MALGQGGITIGAEKRARLVPEMSSRRWQVLAFIRDYIGRMGGSPSYGEIAAALSTNRTRVKEAVRGLVRDGHLLTNGHPRGLALPEDRAAAIRTLRSLGWWVNEAVTAAAPVTDPTLPGIPVLDYFPGLEAGGGACGESSISIDRNARRSAGSKRRQVG